MNLRLCKSLRLYSLVSVCLILSACLHFAATAVFVETEGETVGLQRLDQVFASQAFKIVIPDWNAEAKLNGNLKLVREVANEVLPELHARVFYHDDSRSLEIFLMENPGEFSKEAKLRVQRLIDGLNVEFGKPAVSIRRRD